MTPTELYHLFWRPLLFMATNMVGNEAEDIVADTFLKLIRSKPEFQNLQKAKAWLYITTANSCREFLKKRKRDIRRAKSIEQMDSDPCIEHRIIQTEVMHELWQEVQKLPPQCRKIFMLRLEGKDNGEIATTLHLSQNTIKEQVRIGHRKMRTVIN